MFKPSIHAKSLGAVLLLQVGLLFSQTAFSQPADPPPPPIVDTAAIQQSVFAAYQAIKAAGDAEGKASLTAAEARAAFDIVKRHPVADVAVVDRYDTNGEIGFCYGRAMTSHLLVKQAGLAEDSIRKLFIVGDMRSNPANPEWRFHVTLLIRQRVRANDPNLTVWYALDPIFSRPLPVEEWIRTVRRTWDNWQPTPAERSAAKLYLAPADAVMPDIRMFAPTRETETGNRVIELSFDPSTRADFQMGNMFQDRVYQIGYATAARYFLMAQDPSLQPVQPQTTTFDFLGLHLAVETNPVTLVNYDYRGYFTDLLRFEFSRKFPNDPNPVAPLEVGPREGRSLRTGSAGRRATKAKPNKLGSPRMFKRWSPQP